MATPSLTVTTVTESLPTPSTSSLPPPPPPPAKSAANSSRRAGIIAGSVVGGVVLICLLLCVLIPFLLRRRRIRNESKTDGEAPTDAQDGHGRRTSDATPLMLLIHDSGHDPEAGAYTDVNAATKTISPPIPLKALRQRELFTDTVTSGESSYSQGSTSTPKHRDGNSEHSSSSSPVPLFPPKLPQIPPTEPLSNIGEELRSTLRPGLRRGSRSRNVLPNAPMEPLMEREDSNVSRSTDLNDQEDDRNRWSSAADPGGSRALRLQAPPHLQPYSPHPASLNSSGGFDFGLSLLTSAFRKSISASSIITVGSCAESNNSRNPLHHYPSATSVGATSATGSKTGTYYSAQSDAGIDAGGRQFSETPGTAVRMGMVNSSKPNTLAPRSGSSARTSLSTYPSISSIPNTSPGSNTTPHVPILPPPPAVRSVPQHQSPDPSNPHPPQPPTTYQDQRPIAHIRSASAHRVRAEPHPQLPLARAGRSTHGVIDLVER